MKDYQHTGACAADRDELRDNEHEPTWAETTAMLLSVELQDRPKGRANGKTQTPPIKKALILAFRGTEALKNANVSPSPAGFPGSFFLTILCMDRRIVSKNL